METWEMIKKLKENQKKEFISYGIDEGPKMMAKVNGFGCIIFSYLDVSDDVVSISLNREWEEVKEPVTFMEAVESREKIRVEHRNVKDEAFDEYLDLDEVLEELGEYYYENEAREIILNGKWYIED